MVIVYLRCACAGFGWCGVGVPRWVVDVVGGVARRAVRPDQRQVSPQQAERSSSRTAVTTALARAAHLVVDGEPTIFNDTVARALLGEHGEALLGYHRAHSEHHILAGVRAEVTARARYTEDYLARAIRRGVDQYVILGAGLDSFAYRSPLAERVTVFEVDHGASQAEKRQLLAGAAIPVPPGTCYVPVDFGTDSLSDRLIESGFDQSRPAYVSWLGVSMYLTGDAISATLAVIGTFAPGSELVVEYVLPETMRDARGQAYFDSVMPAVATLGEPWLTFFTPSELSDLLHNHDLTAIEHVQQRNWIDPALWERTDALRPSQLTMLARAGVPT